MFQSGMAELADAADSKSAGTWYLGGSTPPPGTSNYLNVQRVSGSTQHLRCQGTSVRETPSLRGNTL